LEHECKQEQRIRDLESGHAETRVYVKIIREDIAEIKNAIVENPKKPKEEINPLTLKLLELLKIAFFILAGLFGVLKFMGKV
jgi:hypothetical protein